MDDDDGGRERREETRRVNDRFFLAVSLAIFTGICKRSAGFDGSYLTETTKNGHVAFYCASELNKMADMCFTVVIIRIGLSMLGLTFAPVVMRRLREESDMKLTMGFICLLISLCFSAYLRLFVVRWVWVLQNLPSGFDLERRRFSEIHRWSLSSLFLIFFLCFFSLNMSLLLKVLTLNMSF